MKGSLFSYPNIEDSILRQIVRQITEPGLWDDILCPPSRLFLFYGQRGAHIYRFVETLLMRIGITGFAHFKVGLDPKPVKAYLDQITSGAEKGPILIIRNGHLLKLHRELFLQTLNLKECIQSFSVIIVIGKELPDPEHPFYAQFDERVSSGLPPRDDFFKAYDWYLGEWARHWPHSKVILSPEDRMELVYYSSHCVPRDVKLFMRRVFRVLRDLHPEEHPDLTLELIRDPNNRLIYPPPKDSGELWSITDRPVYIESHKFNPTILDHFPQREKEEQEEKEGTRKRLRTEVDFE